MRNMKSIIISVVVLSCLMLLSPLVRGESEKTFIGEIADSQCALNVHSLDRSHKTMIKMGNAGKTPADCARYCVSQRGGKFVLQTKTGVYKIDNQAVAEKSAGQKVKVTGILETKTNTIFLRTIEPLK